MESEDCDTGSQILEAGEKAKESLGTGDVESSKEKQGRRQVVALVQVAKEYVEYLESN